MAFEIPDRSIEPNYRRSSLVLAFVEGFSVAIRHEGHEYEAIGDVSFDNGEPTATVTKLLHVEDSHGNTVPCWGYGATSDLEGHTPRRCGGGDYRGCGAVPVVTDEDLIDELTPLACAQLIEEAPRREVDRS